MRYSKDILEDMAVMIRESGLIAESHKILDIIENFGLGAGTKRLIIAEDTENIKVKNPGILEIPQGKSFLSTPTTHFIKLVNKKGKKAVQLALLNLERWNSASNKKGDPDIRKKAKEVIDMIKKMKIPK